MRRSTGRKISGTAGKLAAILAAVFTVTVVVGVILAARTKKEADIPEREQTNAVEGQADPSEGQINTAEQTKYEYVTSLDDVTEEFFTEYEDEIRRIYEAENNVDEKYVTLLSMNYVTDYCMTLKDGNDPEEEYLLCLVYEIEADQAGTNMMYYWYLGLYNSVVNADGTYEIDLDSYIVPTTGSFFDKGAYFNYTTFNAIDGLVTCTYVGYPEISTLFEELIAGNELYSYEGKEYTEEDDAALPSIERNVVEGAKEYNGHYYASIVGVLSWTEAEAVCESLGGHLVTVTSQEEQDFIGTITDNTVWIGAYADENGDWVWVTGETWSYDNWDGGEPSGGEEQYGCYGWDEDIWRDLAEDSDEPDGFICEWD